METIKEPEVKTISYEDFTKVDIRLGTIKEAVKVEKTDKLIKLQVDFGEDKLRQVVAGIAKTFEPQDLVGKQYLFVVNLVPRPIMGLESTAMILAVGEPNNLGLFGVVETKYQSIELNFDYFKNGAKVG